MRDDRPLQFHVLFTFSVAERLGCNHGWDFQEGCRCCSANQAIAESGVQVSYETYSDGRERAIWGTATTKEQHLAIQRMIAFVRGDREPLELFGADLALEQTYG